MTPVYDFSEYDRDNFVYHFGAYSPEDESLIRLATEASLAAKKAEKSATVTPPVDVSDAPVKRRPMVQRGPAPEPNPEDASTQQEVTPLVPETPATPKPRPMMRPVMKKEANTIEPNTHPLEDSSTDKPVEDSPKEEPIPPRPRPRPVMQRKPEGQVENTTSDANLDPESSAAEIVPPKPRPRPVMQRKPAESDEILPPTALTPTEEKESSAEVPPSTPPTQEITEEEPPKPRARPRPVMRRPENTEGGPEA